MAYEEPKEEIEVTDDAVETESGLTCEQSLEDFKGAYRAKASLIKRQREDYLFRLGKQWDDAILKDLESRKIKAVTDNRIQPNIFLLTGLERQNRTDWRAFPQGEEDSVKAEVATALLKDATKVSDFGYKHSDAFEDAVTCAESHLELYLDNTHNILNGKPCVKKLNGNQVFPEPGFKEYDYSDARYVYKLTADLSKDDLITLFPDKQKEISKLTEGKLDFDAIISGEEKHSQPKDYKKTGGDTKKGKEVGRFDLLERYYKKMVDTVFVGDYKTGEIRQAESEEMATAFIQNYQTQIQAEQQAHMDAMTQHEAGVLMGQIDPITPAPIAPEAQDPERFRSFKRPVPEIWLYAHISGMKKPLADERAWSYPKWKSYPIVPEFAHFSTAPIDGDDAHLLFQGIVHGVKGAQERHNKAETLKLMRLQTSANGGWLTPKGCWTEPSKVEQFGSTPGVNLEYDASKGKPERIFPMPASQADIQEAGESAEAIKAQLGINADLLAAEQGDSQSGRAIALRQKQGLVMVQKLFDNHSRTKQIFGRLLLSQLGEMYDVDTAKKVLGEAFLVNQFPPVLVPVMNPQTGMLEPKPAPDPKTGQPMKYDDELATAVINDVLSGTLDQYDVTVGESVASDTMKLANSMELENLAQKMPGVIPPQVILEESQLPSSTKLKISKSIQAAQAAQQAMIQNGAPPKPPVAA